MTTDENTTRKPIGVPRRFAVGTALIIMTMYAVLFAVMKSAEFHPVAFLIVTVFFTGVGAAQMFLFGGRRPRDASFVAGAVLLPTILVTLIMIAWLSDDRGPDGSEVIGLLLSVIVPITILGVLLGYVAGGLTAGVFLILDRIDKRIHGPRPQGDDPDVRRQPSWDERWYFQIRRLLTFLRPYHRGRPIGDAASLFLIVLILVGLFAVNPLIEWAWWVHLLGVVAVASLLGMLYLGLRLCGWRGLLLLVLLGGAGELGPNTLLPHVFFFTDQPLGEYVPWWLMVVLGCLLGFFILTVVAMQRYQRMREQRPYVRTSFRASVVAVVLLAAVHGVGSFALLEVSKRPRQRALATVHRLAAEPSESLRWCTKPLRGVRLSRETGDDDLKCLAALRELVGIDLSDCSVTDAGLAHLKDLTQLEWVSFDRTRITGHGLRHLRRNTGLTSLTLNGSPITDEGLVSLESFANIRILSLKGTNVTDAVLLHLRNSRNIGLLVLSGTQVTGVGFGCFANEPSRPPEDDPAEAAMAALQQAAGPTHLLLDNAPVTDEGLIHIGKINSLTSLYLSGTKITDDGLVHLGKLNALSQLDLGETQVTGRGLKHLKRLVTLNGVNLNATPTDDAGLVHLGQLPSLDSVSLGGTKITDAGLVRLKGLTKLAQLYLNDTAVTDAGLVHLKGLTKLTYLNLTDTAVTDVGLKHLKGLPSLGCVDLSGTRVSPEGVSELRRATQWRVIVTSP